MHIFSGIVQAAPGKENEAAGLLTELRDAAHAAHGLDTSAWAVVAGPRWGTYALSLRVEGLAQLIEAVTAVSASAAWDQLSGRAGDSFAESAETIFAQAIAATSDEIGQPPLAAISRTVAAPGKTMEAVSAATAILEKANQVTGLDGMLLMSDAGTVNELTWVFGAESGAQADAANAALTADAGWLELLSTASINFQAGTGERMYMMRMP